MFFGTISCAILCLAMAEPKPSEENIADRTEEQNATDTARFFKSFFKQSAEMHKRFEEQDKWRIWISHCGKYSVEARFVDIVDDVVRLKKRDGTVISVPFEEFSKKDRVWIRKQQARMKTP